jgi:L-aminopeptidase/D-esterase-like protein
MNRTITGIKGARVGHAEVKSKRTGCTVLLFDRPAVTAVEARGGWPGTFDTDSVGQGKTFYRKHAIFLTGGDVFGLQCSSGIQRYLIEKDEAPDYEVGYLPGVVGANIYDLDFGKVISKTNYSSLGYLACRKASSKPVEEGNFGAGLGATVGKLRGMRFSMKGGVGSSIASIPLGAKVGALVVTNAVGNVFEKDRTIAGTRTNSSRPDRAFVELEHMMTDYIGSKRRGKSDATKATTIGIVVTDLKLSHEETLKVVEMAHDGMARCTRPAHATTDGDTLFCASTEEKRADMTPSMLDLVGHMAALQVQRSIISAVRHAKSLDGIPGLGDN